LSYNWLNPAFGSNSIGVMYSNTPATVVSATSSVIISQPLHITTINPGNQYIVWASTPGFDYQVLATTNLEMPFQPISGVVPSQGLSTFYNDPSISSNVPQKYYEIEVISAP
ncbi:MAG TPA: hypothetical protein VGY56_00045, partial [Verrucomicrobiae bacterium]|nr:hypothetical protein [Verrucomicrobiae bacterium]